MSTQPVTLDFSKAQPVQQGSGVQLDFSKAQPLGVSMVGPNGETQQVPADNVAQMRQKNFSVTPDNPGVQKMVSPQGQVNYVLPSEAQSFQRAGHTRINPDGSFYLQNIPGEDPLAEQQRYQRVQAALTPQEQSGQNRAAIKEFATTGAEAGVATGLGVAGATASPAVIGASVAAIGKLPGLLKSAWDWTQANPMKAYVLYKIGEEAGIGPSGIKKVLHIASGSEAPGK